MKRPVKVLVFLLIAGVVLSAKPAAALGHDPRLATDFKLESASGEAVTLSNYKGRQSVLLFFWTTWCPYCRRELRVLNGMYERLTKQGLAVLAINIGEPVYKVNNFIKSYHLSYAVLLDRDSTVAYSYDILGIPAYILIDKKGYIRFRDNYFPQEEYLDLISE